MNRIRTFLFRFPLLALALPLLIVVGCNDDDDDGNGGGASGPFSTQGFNSAAVGNNTTNAALDVEALGNGTTVLAGYTEAGGNEDIAVTVFDGDGNQSTGFGDSDGTVDQFFSLDLSNAIDNSVTSGADRAQAVAIDTANSLVLVGGFVTNANGDKDIFISRHQLDGTLDANWNPLGAQNPTIPGVFSADAPSLLNLSNYDDEVVAIRIHTEGQNTFIYLLIKIADSQGNQQIVVTKHELADGAFVNNWGNQSQTAAGVSVFDIAPTPQSGTEVQEPRDLQFQSSNDRGVVAGWINNSSGGLDHVLLGFEVSTGDADTNFGNSTPQDGVFTADVDTLIGATATNVDALEAIAIQTVNNEERIVGVGFVENTNSRDVLFARFLEDGSNLDSTFSTAGLVGAGLFDTNSLSDQGEGIQVSANEIWLAATLTQTANDSDFGLIRLNTDGSIDTTFGTSGAARVDVSGSDDTSKAFTFVGSNGYHVGEVSDGSGGTEFGIARAP